MWKLCCSLSAQPHLETHLTHYQSTPHLCNSSMTWSCNHSDSRTCQAGPLVSGAVYNLLSRRLDRCGALGSKPPKRPACPKQKALLIQLVFINIYTGFPLLGKLVGVRALFARAHYRVSVLLVELGWTWLIGFFALSFHFNLNYVLLSPHLKRVSPLLG